MLYYYYNYYYYCYYYLLLLLLPLLLLSPGLWRVEEDYDDKNDEFGITHQQIENTTR